MLKNLKYTYSLGLSGPIRSGLFLFVKRQPLIEDNAETPAFQYNICSSQDLPQSLVWASSN